MLSNNWSLQAHIFWAKYQRPDLLSGSHLYCNYCVLSTQKHYDPVHVSVNGVVCVEEITQPTLHTEGTSSPRT